MGIFDRKQKPLVAKAMTEQEYLDNMDRLDRMNRNQKADHEQAVKKSDSEHEIAVNELKKQHELELAQMKFEMKNQKDSEVLKYKAEADKAREDMLVLKKELEVTQKIVDINSDIVDVKDIINKLITALPKIDLNSITVNSK